MHLVLWFSDVQALVERKGALQVYMEKGPSRRKIGPQDFHQTFSDPEQFPAAKKRLMVDVQKSFPKCRFKTDLVSSFTSEGNGMKLAGKGDSFINYYLIYEGEALP